MKRRILDARDRTQGEQFLRLAGGLLVTAGANVNGAANSVRVFNTYGGVGGGGKAAGWPVLAELTESDSLPVGGPFWISPDGRILVFRSGQVVNVVSESDLTPGPKPPVGAVVATPRPHQPLAPRPHDKPPYGPVPAATEFAGLKFYLPCDEIRGGAVNDAVSKKPAGRLGTAELVPGPRGRALRITVERTSADRVPDPGLTVIDPAALRIPAGKPFTLALWSAGTKTTGGPDIVRDPRRVSGKGRRGGDSRPSSSWRGRLLSQRAPEPAEAQSRRSGGDLPFWTGRSGTT